MESVLGRIKTDQAIWRYIHCLGIEMSGHIEESTAVLITFIDKGSVSTRLATELSNAEPRYPTDLPVSTRRSERFFDGVHPLLRCRCNYPPIFIPSDPCVIRRRQLRLVFVSRF